MLTRIGSLSKSGYLVALLAVVALVACAPRNVPSQTPTALDVGRTQADTPRPSGTQVRHLPSSTPTALRSLHLTDTPSPSPDPAYQSIPSPDGSLIAKMYTQYRHPTGIATIEILEANGSMLWAIPYQGEQPGGDPRPFLSIYRWAPDSSALYFYYSFSYDGFYTLWDGHDLQRIDIRTGEIEGLIDWEPLVSFSLSPDGTRLAYLRAGDQRPRILIRELTSGEEREAAFSLEALPGAQAGWIEWSPDGNELVFSIIHPDEQMQLMHLRLPTMSMKPLLEYWYLSYTFDEWTEENGLRYIYGPVTVREVVQIDTQTGGVITVGTVTPKP